MSYQPSPVFAADQKSIELASFSTLLRGRSINWLQNALALKYELEYKPVELERKRIASELHDEVLPLLSRLSRSLHGAGASDDLLSSTTTAVLDTIRNILGELHPVDLEELGLNAAVSNLCSRYTKLHGSRIVYRESSEECQLSDRQQLAVYRALQLVLRMFAKNGSGTLILSSQSIGSEYKIVLALRNSDHSAVKALISEMTEQELEEFAGWSNIAQMQVQLLTSRTPHNVIFSINSSKKTFLPYDHNVSSVDAHSQARLVELETVVTAAQKEWAQMLNHDTSVTGNMAVAIERQRLCRTVEELVYPGLEKISRLAKEAAGKSQSGAKETLSTEDLAGRIEAIKAVVDNVITATYPEELLSLNLIELIGLSVEQLKRSTLITAKVVAGKVEHLQDLALEKKIAAFRIIHEALHNVEKHSQATMVLVLVEPAKDHVVLCVEDNGLGLGIGHGESGNIDSRGIRSVKDRAQEIGASVSWQSSISYETGTLVIIKLPIS